MDIIYNKESVLYKGNKYEAPYRLNGIEKAGKLVEPDFDEDGLIRLVHSERYIEKLTNECKDRKLIAEVVTDDFTLEAARKAVSTTVYAAESGDFAAVRPPGHHATKNAAAGFCFFNNISIAAKYLLNKGEKVCILDIDGHYGNGTENTFYRDGRVLFWSIYQLPLKDNPYPIFYDFPPVLRRGYEKALGLIYNIPISEGSGDEKFLEKTKEFIPKIKEFRPNTIGISFGADIYYKDTLLNLKITKEGYEEFGKIIGSLGVKVFGTLEGGYHEDVVSCIEHLVRGINNPYPNTSHK